MVRPERFELPTSWFVARRSIQLSYGRTRQKSTHPHRFSWRRGRDYSSLRSSPFRAAPTGSYPRFVAPTTSRSLLFGIQATTGGEGGIARRYAPRPFAALRDRLRSRFGVSLPASLPSPNFTLDVPVYAFPSTGGEGGIIRRSAPHPFGAAPSGRYPRFVAPTTSRSLLFGVQATTGGEGGIRTLDGLLTHTPLAGARLRPLGHLSHRAMPKIERGMIPVRGSPGKARGAENGLITRRPAPRPSGRPKAGVIPASLPPQPPDQIRIEFQ